MKPLNILLLQPLATEFFLRARTVNYNLAAGYLKAMAQKEGLLEKVEIDILDANFRYNLPGTAGIIDDIVSGGYDLLGFSVYSFNSLQSIFIASEVKKRLPKVKIIFGGPEIVTDAEYIMNNPVIDFGCFGEGEITFVELIKKLLAGAVDYENIKGIFYRKNEKMFITSPREPISDLSRVPSPHLSRILPLKGDDIVLIETTRGCSLKCAYCRANNRDAGLFPAERVVDEIEYIVNCGNRKIFIIDSNFLDSPNFSQICNGIAAKALGGFSIFVNMCVEDLTPEKADMLKACNINKVETGLQSIHSATRKKIHRPRFDREKFIKGVNLLKERNIKCQAGVILGLPDESLKEFEESLSFLEENKISGLFHLLQIFPGSKLWNIRKKHAIKNLALPPYLITETEALSKEEIERVIGLRYGENNSFIIKGLFSQCFEPHSEIYQRISDDPKPELGSLADFYINKATIDLNSSCDRKLLGILGENLSRRVGQIFTVLFRFAASEDNNYYEKLFDLIKSFLLPIASENPYIPIYVIVETDRLAPLDFIGKIKGIINNKSSFLSDSRKLIDKGVVINLSPFEAHKGEFSDQLTSDGNKLPETLLFNFWAVTINQADNWGKKLNMILEKKSGLGIILDFHHDTDFKTIVNVMRFILKNMVKTKFFFKNLAYECLFELLKPLRREKCYWSAIETTIHIDSKCEITHALLPLPKVKLDLVSWQLKAEKFARE